MGHQCPNTSALLEKESQPHKHEHEWAVARLPPLALPQPLKGQCSLVFSGVLCCRRQPLPSAMVTPKAFSSMTELSSSGLVDSSIFLYIIL